jgi:hypothetical protein
MNPFPSEIEKSNRFQQQYTPSAPAPSYAPFRTTFASISLHRSDRLRLIAFPQSDIDAIRGVIKASWRKGIQKEQKYGMSHEFKLYGNPWYGQSDDAITSRVLIRGLLAHLFSVGWILHASTDVSKKELDKDTLFFRMQQQAPPPSHWISISFNQCDRLRLIGADPMLIEDIKCTIAGLGLLQTDLGWKDMSLGAWEFKIKGYPWQASGEETMTTRFLLLKLLERLEANGWSLYASVDQSAVHGEHTSEADSWYCVKDKNWVPGMAVFHR